MYHIHVQDELVSMTFKEKCLRPEVKAMVGDIEELAKGGHTGLLL
jgi:hypothetical protein